MSNDEQPVAKSRGRIHRRLKRVAPLVLLGLGLAWFFNPLRGLPDVGEPPGVAAFRNREVADADNAFTIYKTAAARHVPWRNPADGGEDWVSASPARRQWLQQNQEALALLLEGSERDQAQYIRPRAYTINTILPVTQSLRDLARVAMLEASKRTAEGDPASAWPYFRAVLRASRHSGTNGVAIERLVGAAMWDAATPAIESWAADPRVDRATLQAALADLQAADAMTPPRSDQVIAEYVMLQQTIDNPATRGALRSRPTDAGAAPRPLLTIGGWSFSWDSVRNNGVAMWIRGEPERTNRLMRLAFANWLEYCDRPPAERPARLASGGPRLFIPEPDAPSSLRVMTPEELGRRFESSFLAPVLEIDLFDPLLEAQPGSNELTDPTGLQKEEANRKRLRDVLQLQIETRERAPAT